MRVSGAALLASTGVVGGLPTIGRVTVKIDASALTVRGHDGSAMGLHDTADDGEPESDSCRGAASPLELLEYSVFLAGRQPGPPVRNPESPPCSRRPAAPTSIGVPGGVCFAAFSSRFTSDLLQQDVIDRDQRQIGGELGRSPGDPGAAGSGGSARRRRCRAARAIPAHREGAGLQADHVEQVSHQPVHPAGFLQNGLGEIALGRRSTASGPSLSKALAAP